MQEMKSKKQSLTNTLIHQQDLELLPMPLIQKQWLACMEKTVHILTGSLQGFLEIGNLTSGQCTHITATMWWSIQNS